MKTVRSRLLCLLLGGLLIVAGMLAGRKLAAGPAPDTVGGRVKLLGGFIWTYNEVANNLDSYVNAMANGLT